MDCVFVWFVNVSVLICWTCLCLSFNPPINAFSTSANQHKSHVEKVHSRAYVEEDLAVFRSRPIHGSSALSVQPYSLSINAEDYHYTPKPKHLRPARLLRILGPSFDPFWMSIDRPAEVGVWVSEGEFGTSPPAETTFQDNKPPSLNSYITSSFNFSTSPELIEGAARYQRKLEKEAQDLDLSSFSPEVASSVRAWLVRSTTCGLRYQWVDLGPVFWPRWLRHTDCEQSVSAQSCSFPSGMSCRRAQITQIKILAWHCWGGEDRGFEVIGVADPISTQSGKRCVWRQVPYPVVTACKCSCK